MRILVVEDEEKVARAIAEALVDEHYEVVIALDGEDGFFRAGAETFDLVVLDWMLPGRSGLEVLSVLRRRGFTTPVLVLTARDAVDDRVAGLDSGADDYLVKPFAMVELLARVRALLRRGRTDPTPVKVGSPLWVQPVKSPVSNPPLVTSPPDKPLGGASERLTLPRSAGRSGVGFLA